MNNNQIINLSPESVDDGIKWYKAQDLIIEGRGWPEQELASRKISECQTKSFIF